MRTGGRDGRAALGGGFRTVYLRGGGPMQPSTMEILEVGKK